MAKRQFELNDKQLQELKRYEQASQRVSEAKRLQAVRLYGTGRALADIVDIVGCGASSVRIWAMQYAQSGIEGVLAHYDKSAKNARKLTVRQEQDLREKLHQYRPEEVLSADELYGIGQFWTVEDVKTVVWCWYQVNYRDVSSYRKLLQRCGFSYQKAEQVYKSRPSQVDVSDFEAELEKK